MNKKLFIAWNKTYKQQTYIRLSHQLQKPTSTQIFPANKNGNISIFLAFIIFSVGLNNSRTKILFRRFWMKS